jgi:hypothetical protein
MLSYDLLKNHAGILLCGDYSTLRALHELVHDVHQKSPFDGNKEFFLGLAYDVRKAYEGSRTVRKPPVHSPEIGVRFGVEILWPVLLYQCRVLRETLAFIASTKRQQGYAYLLENIVEHALEEDFGSNSKEILYRWERLSTLPPWAWKKIGSRCAQYSAWTKAQRRKGLSGLLMSLDAMYPTLYPILFDRGEKHLVAPEELDAWQGVDWPDPKW